MIRTALRETIKSLSTPAEKQVSNLIGRAIEAKASGNPKDASDLYMIASCIACSEDEATVLRAAAKSCEDPGYTLDTSDRPGLRTAVLKLHLAI